MRILYGALILGLLLLPVHVGYAGTETEDRQVDVTLEIKPYVALELEESMLDGLHIVVNDWLSNDDGVILGSGQAPFAFSTQANCKFAVRIGFKFPAGLDIANEPFGTLFMVYRTTNGMIRKQPLDDDGGSFVEYWGEKAKKKTFSGMFLRVEDVTLDYLAGDRGKIGTLSITVFPDGSI